MLFLLQEISAFLNIKLSHYFYFTKPFAGKFVHSHRTVFFYYKPIRHSLLEIMLWSRTRPSFFLFHYYAKDVGLELPFLIEMVCKRESMPEA
jgi:hypothetical protein